MKSVRWICAQWRNFVIMEMSKKVLLAVFFLFIGMACPVSERSEKTNAEMSDPSSSEAEVGQELPNRFQATMTALLGVPHDQLKPLNFLRNTLPAIPATHRVRSALLQEGAKQGFVVQDSVRQGAYLGLILNRLLHFQTAAKSSLPLHSTSFQSYISLLLGLVGFLDPYNKYAEWHLRYVLHVFRLGATLASTYSRAAAIRGLVHKKMVVRSRSIPPNMIDQEYLIFSAPEAYFLRNASNVVNDLCCSAALVKHLMGYVFDQRGARYHADHLLREEMTGDAQEPGVFWRALDWTAERFKMGHDVDRLGFAGAEIVWEAKDAAERKRKDVERAQRNSERLLKVEERRLHDQKVEWQTRIDGVQQQLLVINGLLRKWYASEIFSLPVFKHCYILRSDYDRLSQDEQETIASLAYEDWTSASDFLVKSGMRMADMVVPPRPPARVIIVRH